MKLKDLNTPFEIKRMLTYGRDGHKAIRRYVEVQKITGNLYKSRTEIAGWGYEQCRLYLFFPDCPAGFDLGYLSFFGERTVEDMEQDYRENGLDSPERFIKTIDSQIAAGGFIGNPLIEFVRGCRRKRRWNTPQSVNPAWMNGRASVYRKRQNGRKSERKRKNEQNRKKKQGGRPCSAGAIPCPSFR